MYYKMHGLRKVNTLNSNLTERNPGCTPSVCAVIVTWNKEADVLRLLDQLLDLDYPQHKFEIVVVDNHSGDRTAERIEADYQYVTLIRNGGNLGGAGGFNAGMRHVLQNRPGFDYLWLLDNDVQVDPGALRELVTVLEARPDAALCGSRIVDAADRHTTIEIGAFIDARRGDVRSNCPPAGKTGEQRLWNVDYVAACSLLARATSIRECGLFCEALFIYWDDMEWGARFRRAGYAVLATSDSVVYHPSWAHRSMDDSAVWRNFYRIRNGLWYFDLYARGPRRCWLLLKLTVQALLRALLVNLQQGRSHLARAINNAVLCYFKGRFGHGQLALPGVEMHELPLTRGGTACFFGRDTVRSRQNEQILSDIKAYYGIKLICMGDGDGDGWGSASCVDHVVRTKRTGTGRLTLKARIDVAIHCVRHRVKALIWFGEAVPKYLPMTGLSIIRITDPAPAPRFAAEGCSLKAVAFSMALFPLAAGVLVRKWLQRRPQGTIAALREQAGSDLRRHPVDQAAFEYHQWLRATEVPFADTARQAGDAGRCPLFSVVMPVYQPELKYLKAALDSIVDQSCQDFELCISVGSPGHAASIAYLAGLRARHPHVHVIESPVCLGISENTNAALPLVTGRYVVFCDHDDVMHRHALAGLAGMIAEHPVTDLLYTDMDHMDPHGCRHGSRLQPDWSPDLMTSQMYCPHLVCIRKTLLDEIGGLDPVLDGAQDYDLFLRASEKARRIGHVTGVHYSWRQCRTSILSNCMAKPHAFEAARQSLRRAMARRSESAVVLKAAGTNLGIYRVKRRVSDPSVTHILPAGSFVYENVLSMNSVASVPVRVLVTVERGRLALTEPLSEFKNVDILAVDDGTVLAACFNMAANAARTENLIFSGADTELLDSDYPLALLEHVQRPEIGVVGCRLYYPVGALFHCGILMGVNRFAGYAHRHCDDSAGYHNSARSTRNCTAVSWELMAVRKRCWESVGGFDATLPAYADIDFCLKLRDKGCRHVYTPHVSGVLKQRVHTFDDLYHPEAADMLLKRYGDAILKDPYYHPALGLEREDYSFPGVGHAAAGDNSHR